MCVFHIFHGELVVAGLVSMKSLMDVVVRLGALSQTRKFYQQKMPGEGDQQLGKFTKNFRYLKWRVSWTL